MEISYSKITAYLRCPRQFELKYVKKVDYLVSPYLYLGGSVHEAIAWAYRLKMDGETPSIDGLRSIFGQYWDSYKFLEDEEEPREVNWGDENPNDLREAGQMLVSLYWQKIAPYVQPIDVEVPFRRDFGGITLVGKIDLITGTGKLVDLKTKKRAFSDAELARELQPSLYALGMGAQGDIEFDFHTMVKTKNSYVAVASTRRTSSELSWIARELLPRVARAIESGIFPPNPINFLCTPDCDVWHWCKGG